MLIIRLIEKFNQFQTGSRYGRRSNWFKIHCLIQDQAEMTNRLAEQGVIANNGQLTHAFNENKDLVSQYKQEQFRETNSVSSAHHISPNGASPSSSVGSAGGTMSSPYSSLNETGKSNGFQSRYGATSPSFLDTRKEGNNQFGFPSSGLPLSPVSPLSPLNAASRFFFHASAASALFGKGLNGMPKLYNGDLQNYAAYQSRILPIHVFNPMLKSTKDTELNHNSVEFYADLPEQDTPIDLSLKGNNTLSHSKMKTISKSSKHFNGDHDSGFSPSSNEENNNNNTSPLDLTSKHTPEPPTGEDNQEPAESDEDEQHSKSEKE